MENLPAWVGTDPLMVAYMQGEWGKPVRGERLVFERLCLEVFQSGLSWRTILSKREAFRDAFSDFDPDVVAGFDEGAVETLLKDAQIVRNRRKIEAAITNARATVALRTGALAGGGSTDPLSKQQSARPRATAVPYLGEAPVLSSESGSANAEERHGLAETALTKKAGVDPTKLLRERHGHELSNKLNVTSYADLSELVWSYRIDAPVQLDNDGKLPTRSPESGALAKELKLQGFTFVGPTNIYALMCSIGIVDVRSALGI